MSKRPVWNIWQLMKRRCQKEDSTSYPFYGGRGIKVCDRWQIFDNFLADMGEPAEGQSLDRIDSNGHYEPSNCRWATKKEQANNSRGNRILTIDGESKTAAQWAAVSAIDYFTIVRRCNMGWDHKRAVFEPAVKGRNQYSNPIAKHG